MTVKKFFAPILLVVATVFLLGSMFLIQPQAAFAQDEVGTSALSTQPIEQVTNPKAEAYKKFGAQFANIRNEMLQQRQALKLEHQSLKDQTDATPAEMATQYKQMGAQYKELGRKMGAQYKQLGMKMGDQFRQAWMAESVN